MLPCDVQDLAVGAPKRAASWRCGRIVGMMHKKFADPETSDTDSNFLMTDSRL